MRYATIDECEVVNGVGCGTSIYVQGCHFRCPSCFNQSAWDFNGGKEWTAEVEEEFFKFIAKPYIKRVSILGGCPLADENVDGVLNLIHKIRSEFPDKTIWLYTGYRVNVFELPNSDHTEIEVIPRSDNTASDRKRIDVIRRCAVVVDGRFEEDKKDLSLAFRGSSNQRIIDIKQSLTQNEVVLWDSKKGTT